MMKSLMICSFVFLAQIAFAQMPDFSKIEKSIPKVDVPSASADPATGPASAKSLLKTASEKAVVHLNSASPAEIQKVPGISAENANAIVAARPFKSVTDVAKVKGISQSLFAKIKPYLKL